MPPRSALLEPDGSSPEEMTRPKKSSRSAPHAQERNAAEARRAPNEGAAVNEAATGELERGKAARPTRGTENPQEPPDGEDDGGAGGDQSERESASEGSAAEDTRAPTARRGDGTTAKRTTGRRNPPPAMTTEDAARLLSVLFRWVVLFSFAAVLASRCHVRASRVVSRAVDASLGEGAAMARMEGCKRMRVPYEACYGEVSPGTGTGTGTGAAGEFEGADGTMAGLGWGPAPNQCPAPTPDIDHCLLVDAADSPLGPTPGILKRVAGAIVDRNLLLLGFPSPAAVYVHVRECILSALCWSVTFVLIRKWLNPDERRSSAASGGPALHRPNIFQYKYWRGAGYGGLGVYHSAFLRGAAKNFVPRRAFSRLVPDRLRTREVVQGPVYDAVMVGACWGLSQFLFRRRLDPKTRKNMIRRSWRDVAAGSVALSTTSLARTAIKSYFAPLTGLYPLLAFCPDVVGDAARTGLCWGFTYLFVRRGLNPETNSRGFAKRYRNDAVCGSAAMFAFALLKPAARRFVVTYVESKDVGGGLYGGEEGTSPGAIGEASSWAVCTPVISFASME